MVFASWRNIPHDRPRARRGTGESVLYQASPFAPGHPFGLLAQRLHIFPVKPFALPLSRTQAQGPPRSK